MAERIIEADGQLVRLSIVGNGVTDVVFLHGIPGSSHSWDAVLPKLPDSVRAIVPDLVGFGGSSRTDDIRTLHAEGQARILELALRQCGVRHPVLVGHDFGGPVAMRLLMREPGAYSGLVLAATNVFSDTPIPFPLSLLNVPALRPIVEPVFFSRPSLAAMCRFGARRGRIDSGQAVGDREQALAIRAIFAASLTNLREYYGPLEQFLPQVRLPVRVIWGTRDPFFGVATGQKTAAAIDGAMMRVSDGSGHFLPEEDPEQFVEAIVDVLSQSALQRA